MERDIGVALSGGGSRAAAFHLGCLRALHDRGLLPRVRVVSGVSGGALLAALYAYGPHDFAVFDAQAQQLLRTGLEWAVVQRLLTSPRGAQAILNVASLPIVTAATFAQRAAAAVGMTPAVGAGHGNGPIQLRRVNRTTAFVDVLAERAFTDRMMAQVTHPDLDVVLTACDLGTGGAVRFGSRVSACSQFGTIISDVPVASAVAASAAYPAFLPALEERYRIRGRAGDEFERVLLLTDGGVYDNLGLSVLDVERDEGFTPHVYKVKYVIACDAGDGPLTPAAPHIWPSRMRRVVSVMHGRAQHGERGRLYAAAAAGKLSGFVYAQLGMRDNRLPIPVADLVPRDAVVGHTPNFRAMSRENLNMFSTRGEQLVRVLLPYYCPSLC